jgi:hypothetical protein
MMTFSFLGLFTSRNKNTSNMKTVASMLGQFCSKFKARDLIMSGILFVVIVAYGWDADDLTSLPATSPLPQQTFAPAPPQQPTNPGQYGRESDRNVQARFPQGKADYQHQNSPMDAVSNPYQGQSVHTQQAAY